MDEYQYQEMKRYSDINDDMPDGAFFAMAQEMHGWGVEDWVEYSQEFERRDDSYENN